MSWSWKKPLAASDAAVPVHVEFRPPLAQGVVARSDDTWQTATNLASGQWHLAVLVLVIVVVRPLRNSGSALPPLTSEQRRATSTLLSWTVLNTVVSLVSIWSNTAYRLGRMWFPSPDGESLTGVALWHGQEARWDMLQAAVLGFVLCLYGRPRRTVLLFTGLVTGAVCMVPISPGTFGLPSDLLPTPDDAAPAATIACFTAIDAGIVFVWLIGLVACGQHVVHMVRAKGRDKRLRLLRAGVGLAFASVAVAFWTLRVAEWNWQRTSWLSDHTAEDYAARHAVHVAGDMMWFAWEWQRWIWLDWIATTVSFVAVLVAFTPHTVRAPAPP